MKSLASLSPAANFSRTTLLSLMSPATSRSTSTASWTRTTLLTTRCAAAPSASIGKYGVGCGVGPVDLAFGGGAVLGGPGLDLQAQAGQPGALAVLACGFGVIVPVDFDLAGYPGCTLYPQDFSTAFLGVVDGAGNAPSLLFPIPNNPSFSFTQLNCQAAGLAGEGLEFSDAVEAVPGS